MSNAKHTAGPWSRDRYGALMDSSGRHVNFRSISILCAGDGIAEAEANTDLIAAAPEMAELLATFTMWARQVAARSDIPQGIRSAAAQLHDDGKRMLVKATGEQS